MWPETVLFLSPIPATGTASSRPELASSESTLVLDLDFIVVAAFIFGGGSRPYSAPIPCADLCFLAGASGGSHDGSLDTLLPKRISSDSLCATGVSIPSTVIVFTEDTLTLLPFNFSQSAELPKVGTLSVREFAATKGSKLQLVFGWAWSGWLKGSGFSDVAKLSHRNGLSFNAST
jgi:hypothetical protein